MSIHIGAKHGEIAETVLISGDPLRAQYIAEHLLQDSRCYTRVRNMLGYTGSFEGKKISVQGTGMGQASLAIYLHELIHEYGVKTIIRVGTCGALEESIQLGAIVIAQGACTDGTMNKVIFNGLDFAPIADFNLLQRAYKCAEELQQEVRVGNVFSTDLFYFENDPDRWDVWRKHQLLCADMETSTLYTMASRHDVNALSILTVSDNIISGKSCDSTARERSFTKMVELALKAV